MSRQSDPTAAPMRAEVTRGDITAAEQRIRPYIRHTPLEHSPELTRLVGADVYLKVEALQVTGSFKPRLSLNVLLSMSPASRARGAVASTAGGHGIGLAYAAQRLGVAACIYLPRHADPTKIAAIRALGADLAFTDSVDQARAAAQEHAARSGARFVSAYNHPLVIAGGGTVGLEIGRDLPDVDLVVLGMGGGGLAAGTGIALCDEGAAIWAVQPAASPILNTWLRAGRPVEVSAAPSIADGLGAHVETGTITFPLTQRHVSVTSEVSEDDIRAAMRWLAEAHHLYVEPSAAAPVAALIRRPDLAYGRYSIVVVLTGRNIALNRWLELVNVPSTHSLLPGIDQ
ncbi:threonine dehydratase [Kribbella orskensis]|uniref:Threonine dehydratase n=1 Tax=Kribbella orskensis TaxID=2512216 RepID=A0ABY2BM53_9ACTN|nr:MULTISPECIES: pyridoxal-phosphate dependent enzyme [Kribbella]TCN41626.1 threonine dehydratase [Kribbella sp. VKM Ac-2500]TCO25504.1 threonine dehydratase [Kribbella orskensis]